MENIFTNAVFHAFIILLPFNGETKMLCIFRIMYDNFAKYVNFVTC